MSDGNGTDNGTVEYKLVPFDHLKGNIKGDFEHRLSPCTAFVGRNRHGKTARLEAFKLALTGTHPVGPHGSNLMELAPNGAFDLRVMVRAVDAGSQLLQQSSYKVEIEGGKAKKAEKPDRLGLLRAVEQQAGADKLFENMLPAASMRDLIRMGSTLGREALFKRFGDISSIPTPRGLSDEQKTMWDEGIASVRKEKPMADTAEVLAASSAWFRQRKLALGRELKALKNLVKEREVKLAPETAGAEDLPGLKRQLADAQAWERSSELRAAKARLEAEAVEYRKKIQPFLEADKPEAKAARDAASNEEAARLQATIATLTAEMQRVQNVLTAMQAAYTAKLQDQLDMLTFGHGLQKSVRVSEGKMDADGNALCVLCGNTVHVPTLKAAISPRVEARKASVEALKAEHEAAVKKVDAEFAAAEAALRVAENEYSTWDEAQKAKQRSDEAQKNLLRQEGQRLKGALDQNALALKAVPASYEGLTSVELEGRIKLLETAESASKNLDEEVAKVRQLSLSQEVAKVLEQEASTAVASLLAKTAETANGAVNKYMPDGFKAQLDLENAQWTVVGSDGRPHDKRVMAGSEMGALTVALALAWTEGAPGRFLVLDDEDLAFFDPENLGLLLGALKDAVDDGLLTQVLLAWSRPSEIPDGWLKIHVDRPESGLAILPPPAAVAAPTAAVPVTDGLLL